MTSSSGGYMRSGAGADATPESVTQPEPEAAKMPVENELCPQGRTDYEACFAPFRYCPVEGCGRMEQTLEPTPEVIQAATDAAPTTEAMWRDVVGRVKHAIAQIDYALADSRIDGAAAAWLRTIKAGLDGTA